MAENMSITIQASGNLRQYVAAGKTLCNVHTVGAAVTQLNLPETGELLLLVNGRLAYWDTELADGDVLKLVPAISGGLS